jgi:hypothetical protein
MASYMANFQQGTSLGFEHKQRGEKTTWRLPGERGLPDWEDLIEPYSMWKRDTLLKQVQPQTKNRKRRILDLHHH